MSNPTSTIVPINGEDICIHKWTPQSETATPSSTPVVNGVVLIFHGFLAHARFPTVRYAAEELVKANYIVMAADARGHGLSTGLRGYLPSAEQLVADGVAVATEVVAKQHAGLPLFLLGSSMGGNIALHVSQQLAAASQEELNVAVAGVVLLAPMLQLNVDPMSRILLKSLSYIIPTVQVIPSSSTNAEKQYRDEVKRKECEDDEMKVAGSTIRVGSANTCVELVNEIQKSFSQVQIPLLVMIAEEDVVVNNQGAIDLYDKAPSADKTMKRYPALHGMLCEPSPLIDQIKADLVQWIQDRSKSFQ